MTKESINEVLKRPELAKQVNPGLSGKTFIDHVIGVVINEVETHGNREYKPLLDGLKTEYPLHFGNGTYDQNKALDKNSSYKARNGF